MLKIQIGSMNWTFFSEVSFQNLLKLLIWWS